MSGSEGAERARAVTVRDLLEMKRRVEEVVALAAVHYSFARLLHESSVDAAPVGDSPGQVVLGCPSTLAVTFLEATAPS